MTGRFFVLEFLGVRVCQPVEKALPPGSSNVFFRIVFKAFQAFGTAEEISFIFIGPCVLSFAFFHHAAADGVSNHVPPSLKEIWFFSVFIRYLYT